MACLLWKKKNLENQIKKNLIMKGTNKIIKAMRYMVYIYNIVLFQIGVML